MSSPIHWTVLQSGVSQTFAEAQHRSRISLHAALHSHLLRELIEVACQYAACLYTSKPDFINGEVATAMVEGAKENEGLRKAADAEDVEAAVQMIPGPFGLDQATSVLSRATNRLYTFNEGQYSSFDTECSMARRASCADLHGSQRYTALLADSCDTLVLCRDDSKLTSVFRRVITTTITFYQVVQGEYQDSYTMMTLFMSQSEHTLRFAAFVPEGLACRFISEDETHTEDVFIRFVPQPLPPLPSPPKQVAVQPLRQPLRAVTLNQRQKDQRDLHPWTKPLTPQKSKVKVKAAAPPHRAASPVTQNLLDALKPLLKDPEVAKDRQLHSHLEGKWAELQEEYPNKDLSPDDANYLNRLKGLMNDKGAIRRDVRALLLA